MDSISLKVPVKIKAKLTEKLKNRMLSEIDEGIKRAELEARAAGETPSQGPLSQQPAPTKAQEQAAKDEQPVPASTGRNVKTREQRRAEAEARNAANKAVREEKKRLKQVEAALKPAQKRYKELMDLMASEELYNNADEFDRCMKEYNALSKKIPALEDEWLELTTMIEEATRV